MPDYDVIVIGAGHNALVCAGYLAQAGQRVAVFERRGVAGGAVVTEEHVPGFRFDLGGSAHILIHHTPIVADLGLTRYGLKYIDMDPLFFAPFPDGSHFFVWKEIERTCESIAQISPVDAENYRRFINDWTPMAEGMVEAFNSPPTAGNLVRNLGMKSASGDQWETRLRDILSGYGPLLRRTFVDERVAAAIGWMAAQSGPPPGEPLSGPFALWHPMYHVSGAKRPEGGSGMLTQALQRMIQDHGGQVFLNSPVQRILVERGRAAGIETVGGERATARAIVSGAHVLTTLRMLGEEAPPKAHDLLNKARVGNGFGMVIRYAMRELPDYVCLPSLDGAPGPQHRALQLICPSLDYLDAAYADYLKGQPSGQPALVGMTFSAIDPTLAPPGQHTMFLWMQYAPYKLADGRSWDQMQEQIDALILGKMAEYAPNVRDAVIGKLVETPLYLERELGLLGGNVMHLEMSIDQMFMLRPAIGLSGYQGPVKGLFLTGASTHPGGGIMGAAGRNASQVVMRHLRRRWL